MAQQIIIQQELHQMQAAIVEDGRLAEYYLQPRGCKPPSHTRYCATYATRQA